MAEPTEGEKSESLELPAPAPTLSDKLSVPLKPLVNKSAGALTILAASPGAVLPAKFYEGASLLQTTPEEKQKLAEWSQMPDDEVEIRSDGIIYTPHEAVERALRDIFGTEWCIMEASDTLPEDETGRAYTAFALFVRGHFIGRAIGWAEYKARDKFYSKADAFETCRSDAIVKIAGKSSLGIGANLWNKRFRDAWRKQYAIRVWITDPKDREKKKSWRRKDAPPIEDRYGNVIEEKPVQPAPATNAAAQSSVGSTTEPLGAASPPSNPPTAQPKAPQKSRPSKPSAAAAEPPSKEPPKQSTEQMVAENNIRLFMAEARRRKLVVGNDATSAVTFLVDKIGLPFDPAKFTGKTQIEIIRHLLLGQTWRRFTDEILPKLREVQA